MCVYCGEASATRHTYGGQLQELVLCFPYVSSWSKIVLQSLGFCCLFLLLFGTGSHHLAPGWFGTPYIDQVIVQLTEISLPLPSQRWD